MGLIKILCQTITLSLYFKSTLKSWRGGFKGIITDLDNTLVGWDVKSPTIEIQQWFYK